jgi:hypothetical protein
MCFIQWIFVIAQESHYELTFDKHKTNNITNNKANNITDFSNFELILFPLAIEFRICCGVELGIIFSSLFFNEKNKHNQNKIGIKETTPWIIFSVFTVIIGILTFIMFQFNNAFTNYFDELVINNNTSIKPI